MESKIGAALRVGGLLRRGMSIFATPSKAGIQNREGQDEAAGDGFHGRFGLTSARASSP
jgi:hypothetical protein